MKVFVTVLFALAIFVNVWTLKDGHNWGDDFAQYIINAYNIIDGKPFASGVVLEKFVISPPGLPLLLVPVLKVFGLNFKALKLLNVFFWYSAVYLLFLLLSKKEGSQFALKVAILLAASSFFFTFKQNVLSDIPFFLFVCSSLYTFECWENNSSHRHRCLFFILFLLSMSEALWLRSAGSILFIAALFYFIFIKSDRKALAEVLIVFIINEISLFLWMGWSPGELAIAGQMPHVFFTNVLGHFAAFLQSLWYFFCPSQTVYSRALV